jgi:hypothetical protein
LLPKKTSLIFDTFDLHALAGSKCGGVANYFIGSKTNNKFFGTLDISAINPSAFKQQHKHFGTHLKEETNSHVHL